LARREKENVRNEVRRDIAEHQNEPEGFQRRASPLQQRTRKGLAPSAADVGSATRVLGAVYGSTDINAL